MKTKKLFFRLKNKLKIVLSVLRAKGITSSIHIAPDNEARAVIESILKSHMKVVNSEQGLVIKTLADKILQSLKQPGEKALNERIENLLDGVLSQAFWYHSQLAGLTTLWEFRLRIFASRVGIHPNVPVDEKSKKNRANKSVEHRSLRDTIRELNAITGDRMNLKLFQLCELRDSIVHCNPQGLKSYAVQLFGKDVLKPVRGNVVVLDQVSGEVRNISDATEESQIEQEDTVAWFLEVFNSSLPKMAFGAFEESVAALSLLQEFNAVSFGDRKLIFNRLVFEGKRPTAGEIQQYQDYFSSNLSPIERNAEEFFDKIMKYFKNVN